MFSTGSCTSRRSFQARVKYWERSQNDSEQLRFHTRLWQVREEVQRRVVGNELDSLMDGLAEDLTARYISVSLGKWRRSINFFHERGFNIWRGVRSSVREWVSVEQAGRTYFHGSVVGEIAHRLQAFQSRRCGQEDNILPLFHTRKLLFSDLTRRL